MDMPSILLNAMYYTVFMRASKLDARLHKRFGPGQQTDADLLGGVVPRATLQWQLAERKARLTAG
ncbi:hypothetical protein N5O88_14310 [Pseudomonas sp. GD03721]|nr:MULTISPECIES: hypothetical protein [unclassified Pseudomonas]MDH1441321.1 hypothetical protein [Pseudomonas sp. GD03722]WGG00285.1 hypothetical protein N5O88_14310 [Pseudomonas sp. GD03721]WGG04451.1 hypothetical protein N5O87_14320 [Pseudomonas sp. GD03919]